MYILLILYILQDRKGCFLELKIYLCGLNKKKNLYQNFSSFLQPMMCKNKIHWENCPQNMALEQSYPQKKDYDSTFNFIEIFYVHFNIRYLECFL